MPITAVPGPYVAYGQTPPVPGSTTSPGDSNSHIGPSCWIMGSGILDPRWPYTYVPDQSQAQVRMWWGDSQIQILDQVPSTASTSTIAAAQVPVAGTAMTLVSSTGGGITVSTSITRADTGVAVTVLAIDSAMSSINLTPAVSGPAGPQPWDPRLALARTVQLLSVGNDSGGTVTVRGYDVYSYPMSETITLTNASTAVGAKAFKYIASITPAGTLSGANLSAGQSDTIGLMLRSDRFQLMKIYWPDNTLISASTGYTAAVTTTATATTGDVRGTYALQVASNNTRRLVMFVNLPPQNVGTTAGLVGVTQFSN